MAELRGVPVFCNSLWPTAGEARGARSATSSCATRRSPATSGTGRSTRRWSPTAPPTRTRCTTRPASRTTSGRWPTAWWPATGCTGARSSRSARAKGNFLALLCERGHNWGLGYDAAYDPERLKVATSPRMRIVRAYYPFDRPVDGELVVCQHVLEHLAEPAALVEGVRRSIPDGARTAVYFEVPDATYMVSQLAVWDLIYEHVSYFAGADAGAALPAGGLRGDRGRPRLRRPVPLPRGRAGRPAEPRSPVPDAGARWPS